ncbi:MAG: hypothetical protein K8L97_15580 [Anaerolineae bacterium]|nr:hypothetical protein [Anaerolineae bacterium]
MRRRVFIGFQTLISREWALWLSWLSDWIWRTKRIAAIRDWVCRCNIC